MSATTERPTFRFVILFGATCAIVGVTPFLLLLIDINIYFGDTGFALTLPIMMAYLLGLGAQPWLALCFSHFDFPLALAVGCLITAATYGLVCYLGIFDRWIIGVMKIDISRVARYTVAVSAVPMAFAVACIVDMPPMNRGVPTELALAVTQADISPAFSRYRYFSRESPTRVIWVLEIDEKELLAFAGELKLRQTATGATPNDFFRGMTYWWSPESVAALQHFVWVAFTA